MNYVMSVHEIDDGPVGAFLVPLCTLLGLSSVDA